MKKNLVSIIMPYYNKSLYFKKAYNSAKKQTYPHKEIIIIFDGSSCYELEFIKKIISKDKITRLIVNHKNMGVSFSRNLGIKKSKGKYIAFLDCDDVWKINKLDKQIQFMNKNNFRISHTSYNYIDSKNAKIGEFRLKNNLNYANLLNSCDIGLSTVIVEKNILGKNPFPSISSKEDYVLWLKIIKKFKFGYISTKLSDWRKLKKSLSGNFMKKIMNGFLVYYKFEGFGFFSSVIKILKLSYYSLKKK
jgi:teichuronic acid biosynthesis glycosyltransferase TuaG